MQKKKFNSTIKATLVVWFLILSLIPMTTVGVFSYISSMKTVEKQVGDFSLELLKQTVSNFDYAISQVEKASMMVISNHNLMVRLSTTEYEDSAMRFADFKEIQNDMAVINETSGCGELLIVLDNGERHGNINYRGKSLDYIISKEFTNSPIWNKAYEANGNPIWLTGINDDYNQIYMMRALKSTKNRKNIGLTIVSVKSEIFTEKYENINLKEGAVFSISNDEKMVLLSNTQETGSFLDDTTANLVYSLNEDIQVQEGNIITYATCKNGWKIINKVPVSALMTEMNTVGSYIIILGAICVVIALVLSILISVSISNPIKDIMSYMKKAENGDLTVRSQIKGKKETIELAKSFNNMVDKISAVLSVAKSTANKVVTESENVSNVAVQTAVAANEVFTAIEHNAEGMTAQAIDVNTGLDIITELANKINEVTSNVQSVSDAAIYSKELGDDADTIISELNKKSKDSIEISKNLMNEINELNISATQINEITEVITGISEQTNLLAINAAIEAARAGAAGSGFSVVAAEIKKLSDQARTSADTISDIISLMQDKMNIAVSTVENVSHIFNEQEIYVSKTEESFDKIVNAMNDVLNRIINVERIIDEINMSKDNIVNCMTNISRITVDSVAVTEEIMASSENQTNSSERLAQLSDELKKEVESLDSYISNFRI